MKPSSMKNIDIEGSESFCEENSLAEENYNDDGDNEDEEDMFGDETPNAGNTGTSSKRTTMAIRYFNWKFCSQFSECILL